MILDGKSDFTYRNKLAVGICGQISQCGTVLL
jgi:hypothetical protein